MSLFAGRPWEDFEQRIIATAVMAFLLAVLYGGRSTRFGRAVLRSLPYACAILALAVVCAAIGAIFEFVFLAAHWFEAPQFSFTTGGAVVGAVMGVGVVAAKLAIGRRVA